MLKLAGCSSTPGLLDITGAEQLTILSGSTGESVDITDAEDIKAITDSVNTLEYVKGEKENGDGWSYGLRWYDGNGELIESLTLLGDGVIIYDGYYYYLEDSSLYHAIESAFPATQADE